MSGMQLRLASQSLQLSLLSSGLKTRSNPALKTSSDLGINTADLTEAALR